MPLLAIRDKVAARLAFIEVYERMVSQARREGRPVEVIVSLGDDKARRQIAIEDGLRNGMLTKIQAEPHLLRISQENQAITPDGSAIAGLLAGHAGTKPMSNEERQRRLQEVRSQIGIGARGVQAEKSHAHAMADRQETERRKREVLDKIDNLSSATGSE